ncbi:MAG: AAA family ATPase [Pseudomonas sp.]
MSQHLHLKRIRLEQFRRFESTIEIPGLEPGLNVLFGPQETGKSTIASAIRAAFLERCGSSVHDDYLPRGNTGASPTVEVDFSFAGTDYQLAKTFMHKTRCDLQVGAGQRHNGQVAEDLLAELMGFGFPGKGKNRNADNLGIPGLLWVEQGHSEAAAAIRGDMAAKRLSHTLQSDVGEMTSTAGNALIDRLTQERSALLTDGGKPRKGSPLFEAQEAVSTLEQEVSTLEAKAGTYRERVDQYAQLLPELDQIVRDKPWEQHRKQAEEASKELKAAEELTGRHTAAVDNLVLATRHLRSLESTQQQQQTLREELDQLKAEVDEAAGQMQRLDQQEAQAKHQRDLAKGNLDAAREHLRTQRLIQEYQDLQQEAGTLGRQLVQLEQTLGVATGLADDLRDVVTRQSTLDTNADDVEALKELTDNLRITQATIEGAATRLEFELASGVEAQLDGEPISATGNRLLTDSATLVIDGVGQLMITPGGEELEQLRDTLGQLTNEHSALLSRLGVPDLQTSIDRLRDFHAATAKATNLRQRMEDLVPEGIHALVASIESGNAKLKELRGKCDGICNANPALELQVDADEALADSRHEEAARRYEKAVDDHNQTKGLRQAKSALVERLREDLESRQERLDDPAAIKDREDLKSEIATGADQVITRTAEVDALATQIAEADIGSIKLKHQRYESAERVARQRHSDLSARKERIEALLQEEDAFGLEERLAEHQQKLEAARRRHGQYALRARALDHLLARLGEHRRTMTDRLNAPLAESMQPFLDMLLPGTSPVLEIDESMTPAHLTRTGTRSSTHPVDDLSYGTREQLWLITRLAYGSLLSRRGQPAMIMLDDPLTHSDNDRLELMKRILLKGATDCQVLLFTCQPERWADSGAPMFDLRALEES